MSMKMEIFLNLSREEKKSYLDYLDSAYYNKNKSVVTDEEYDTYRRKYIELYGKESLDYVPGSVSSIFKKYKHKVPVISLGKFQETELDKIKLYCDKLFPIVIEPKYDGLTVVAYPTENNKVLYVTRGSGIEGEILPNFIERYEGINFKSKYPIRGEVLLSYKNFLKIKEIQKNNGEKQFKQIRNAASGILRSKERSKFINYLSFICYDVIGLDVSEKEKLSYIKNHTPFDTTVYEEVPSIDKIVTQMHDMFNLYSKVIPLDGMVIKTLQNNSLQKYGTTNHHPKNSFAVKWNQTSVVTTIRDIHWQIGKTGAVTPVASFDPIEILGSTVSQASLSNPDEIKRLNLHIGDQISVIKAREIIPKIVLNLDDNKHEDCIQPPKTCPSCGSVLKKEGPILKCANSGCKEKIAQQMAFLARKDVLNIDGLSIETCRKIIEHAEELEPRLLKGAGPYSIFYIPKESFYKVFGTGKQIQNLYSAIEECRSTGKDFRNFVPALLIDGVGHHAADILLQYFGDTRKALDSLRWQTIDFSEIPGFGPATAAALNEHIANERIGMLFAGGIWVNYESVEKNDNSFAAGKTFVLTGKMPKKRSEYEAMIKAAGGKVTSSVSANTDYLVIADVNSTSSKAIKARALNTTLISPEDLEVKLKGDDSSC